MESHLQIGAAGVIAALGVDLLVYPLDTLKTRLQSPDNAQLLRHGGDQWSFRPHSSLFRGLYHGVGSVTLLSLPASGAFFITYEATKESLSTALDLHPIIASAVSSSTAEAVSCAFLTPAEVLKQNAQMLDINQDRSTDKNAGASRAGLSRSSSVRIFNQFSHHPMKMWRGYSALLARNLPFTALNFPVFETMKSGLTGRWRVRNGQASMNAELGPDKKRKGLQSPKTSQVYETVTVSMLSAMVSGSIAAFVTTPIDVIKTRIMLHAGDETKNGQYHKGGGYPTISNVGISLYRREGVAELFRGAALRSIWTSLGMSLYLGSYDLAKLLLVGGG